MSTRPHLCGRSSSLLRLLLLLGQHLRAGDERDERDEEEGEAGHGFVSSGDGEEKKEVN